MTVDDAKSCCFRGNHNTCPEHGIRPDEIDAEDRLRAWLNTSACVPIPNKDWESLKRVILDVRADARRLDKPRHLAMRNVVKAARAFEASIMVECREGNSTCYNDEHDDLIDAFELFDALDSRLTDNA